MQIIISPAKTLDYKTPISIQGKSEAVFLNKSQDLIKILQKYSPSELAQLMKTSPKIAYLNHDRIAQWTLPFDDSATRQAVLAFKGEVFHGIDAYSLSQEEMNYTQDHLHILSGLYGILKPLDAILPYRLEMGTKLKGKNFNHLYDFWGNSISLELQKALDQEKTPLLINLASQEYFKAIKAHEINARIITPIFKELKNDEYKVVSIYAKKARGLMTRFIIKNKIEKADDLKLFDKAGYYFNERLSSELEFVFTR